jgi:hypothetical protein
VVGLTVVSTRGSGHDALGRSDPRISAQVALLASFASDPAFGLALGRFHDSRFASPLQDAHPPRGLTCVNDRAISALTRRFPINP